MKGTDFLQLLFGGGKGGGKSNYQNDMVDADEVGADRSKWSLYARTMFRIKNELSEAAKKKNSAGKHIYAMNLMPNQNKGRLDDIWARFREGSAYWEMESAQQIEVLTGLSKYMDSIGLTPGQVLLIDEAAKQDQMQEKLIQILNKMQETQENLILQQTKGAGFSGMYGGMSSANPSIFGSAGATSPMFGAPSTAAGTTPVGTGMGKGSVFGVATPHGKFGSTSAGMEKPKPSIFTPGRESLGSKLESLSAADQSALATKLGLDQSQFSSMLAETRTSPVHKKSAHTSASGLFSFGAASTPAGASGSNLEDERRKAELAEARHKEEMVKARNLELERKLKDAEEKQRDEVARAEAQLQAQREALTREHERLMKQAQDKLDSATTSESKTGTMPGPLPQMPTMGGPGVAPMEESQGLLGGEQSGVGGGPTHYALSPRQELVLKALPQNAIECAAECANGDIQRFLLALNGVNPLGQIATPLQFVVNENDSTSTTFRKYTERIWAVVKCTQVQTETPITAGQVRDAMHVVLKAFNGDNDDESQLVPYDPSSLDTPDMSKQRTMMLANVLLPIIQFVSAQKAAVRYLKHFCSLHKVRISNKIEGSIAMGMIIVLTIEEQGYQTPVSQ